MKRGRKRYSEKLAEDVRWMYHNTDCSVSQVARHYGISEATADKMIMRKGAYTEREVNLNAKNN